MQHDIASTPVTWRQYVLSFQIWLQRQGARQFQPDRVADPTLQHCF